MLISKGIILAAALGDRVTTPLLHHNIGISRIWGQTRTHLTLARRDRRQPGEADVRRLGTLRAHLRGIRLRELPIRMDKGQMGRLRRGVRAPRRLTHMQLAAERQHGIPIHRARRTLTLQLILVQAAGAERLPVGRLGAEQRPEDLHFRPPDPKLGGDPLLVLGPTLLGYVS